MSVVPDDDLYFEKQLAKGAFGSVWKGKIKSKNMIVAIKVLSFSESLDISDPDDLAQFEKGIKEIQNEINLLSTLRHRNIVQFMGASLKPPNFNILMEYVEGGSLYDLLHKKRKSLKIARKRMSKKGGDLRENSGAKIAGGRAREEDGNQDETEEVECVLPWKHKVNMLLQIASGIMFIHAQSVIHRDLKSHNILLGGSIPDAIIPKICDFGLSKTRGVNMSQKVMTQAVGTPLWMAPEVVLGNTYSYSCDVFSFSIMICEMMTETLPYLDMVEPHMQGNIHFKVATQADFRPRIPARVVDDPENFEAKSLVELMKQGWSQDPAARPSSKEVYERLKAIASVVNALDPN